MRVMSLLLALLLIGCGGPARDVGPTLTLTWQGAPGAEEYVIERDEAGIFRELARVPASRTEYVDRAVQRGVEYCYHVRARNRAGLSSASPRQCGTPKP